jgi:hypothetical protein
MAALSARLEAPTLIPISRAMTASCGRGSRYRRRHRCEHADNRAACKYGVCLELLHYNLQRKHHLAERNHSGPRRDGLGQHGYVKRGAKRLCREFDLKLNHRYARRRTNVYCAQRRDGVLLLHLQFRTCRRGIEFHDSF